MTNNLRQQAEDQVKAQDATAEATLSPEEMGKILHELRVHQIELEMQNEELRRTQVELDAAKERYFDLYDMAPTGYVTLNEDGQVLEANLTISTMLGVSRAELTNHPLSRYIYRDDQDTYFLRRKSMLMTGSPQLCDLRMVKKDGTQLWANMLATVRHGLDGSPECRIAVIDISQRKRDEEVLRESELRFQQLLQTIPTVSVQGYSSKGTVIYWNEASERLYGYTAQEALGENLLDLIIPPEMRSEVQSAIYEMVSGGKPIPNSELQLMRKDGSPVSVFSSHAVIHVPGVGPELFCMDFDLSEQKRTEKALRDSEEKYRIVADFTYDWETWISPDGDLLYISPACERITGHSAQEFVSSPTLISKIIHPDDKGKYLAHQDSLLPEREAEDIEFRIITKDGRVRWINHCCQAVHDSLGNHFGRRGSNRDITERKLAEDSRILIERIIQHDLRAPAANAVNTAILLRLDGNMTADQLELLQLLENAGRDMLDTLNRSLELYKIELGQYRGENQEFDCLPTIRETCKGTLNQLQQVHAHLVILLNGVLPAPNASFVCQGQPDLLKTALNNLIQNALEASPKGETVYVNLVGADRSRIEIRNKGMVPPDVRDRFFQKFVTSGKTYGTGLGTYSAMKMIEAQGGSVEMTTSDEMDETVVTIHMPT